MKIALALAILIFRVFLVVAAWLFASPPGTNRRRTRWPRPSVVRVSTAGEPPVEMRCRRTRLGIGVVTVTGPDGSRRALFCTDAGATRAAERLLESAGQAAGRGAVAARAQRTAIEVTAARCTGR